MFRLTLKLPEEITSTFLPQVVQMCEQAGKIVLRCFSQVHSNAFIVRFKGIIIAATDLNYTHLIMLLITTNGQLWKVKLIIIRFIQG